MMAIELIGYIATAFIVASLSMKSIVRLRAVNLTGALIFSVYGFLISSLPVIALNLTTAGLNIFHLSRLRRKTECFEILEAKSIDEPYMQKFLSFYREDIVEYFGVPDLKRDKDYIVCYILRNMVTAGIFVGEKVTTESTKEVDIKILIDYVTPEYRDLKNSKFLFYGNQKWLNRLSVRRFYISNSHPKHVSYLKKLGFTKTDNEDYEFRVPTHSTSESS